jgi:hypothetical protein
MSQENGRQPERPAMPAVGSPLDSATRVTTQYDATIPEGTIMRLDMLFGVMPLDYGP